VKTPNDPTTIAKSRESLAGVDEPTTTSQTLAAWILAKDYERLKAERDELRAACEAAKLAFRATSKRVKDYSYELELLHAALSKGTSR
jgi:uroporphyrinogen-III decarboxylase